MLSASVHQAVRNALTGIRNFKHHPLSPPSRTIVLIQTQHQWQVNVFQNLYHKNPGSQSKKSITGLVHLYLLFMKTYLMISARNQNFSILVMITAKNLLIFITHTCIKHNWMSELRTYCGHNIWSSYRGDHEDSCVLGYATVSTGNCWYISLPQLSFRQHKIFQQYEGVD